MWRVVLVSILGSTVREAREQQARRLLVPRLCGGPWPSAQTLSLFLAGWSVLLKHGRQHPRQGRLRIGWSVCVSRHMECVSERVQAIELWGGDKPLRTGKLTPSLCVLCDGVVSGLPSCCMPAAEHQLSRLSAHGSVRAAL